MMVACSKCGTQNRQGVAAGGICIHCGAPLAAKDAPPASMPSEEAELLFADADLLMVEDGAEPIELADDAPTAATAAASVTPPAEPPEVRVETDELAPAFGETTDESGERAKESEATTVSVQPDFSWSAPGAFGHSETRIGASPLALSGRAETRRDAAAGELEEEEESAPPPSIAEPPPAPPPALPLDDESTDTAGVAPEPRPTAGEGAALAGAEAGASEPLRMRLAEEEPAPGSPEAPQAPLSRGRRVALRLSVTVLLVALLGAALLVYANHGRIDGQLPSLVTRALSGRLGSTAAGTAFAGMELRLARATLVPGRNGAALLVVAGEAYNGSDQAQSADASVQLRDDRGQIMAGALAPLGVALTPAELEQVDDQASLETLIAARIAEQPACTRIAPHSKAPFTAVILRAPESQAGARQTASLQAARSWTVAPAAAVAPLPEEAKPAVAPEPVAEPQPEPAKKPGKLVKTKAKAKHKAK
jgi:hypothetical protein